jgi:Flp pilus assembly protein TadG
VIRRRRERGQSLVEFALVIPVFLLILMGVVDFGMAIYKFNGVSQAAREIARVTSVHPCAGTTPCAPGSSAETAAVIQVQKGLIPGLANPTFRCVDSAGQPVAPNPCNFAQDSVEVTVTAPYRPVTPILGSLVTWTMKGISSAQLQ